MSTLFSKYQDLVLNEDHMESMGQELYNCPTFSLSGRVSVLRIRKVLAEWTISGHLLSPAISHNCQYHNVTGSCDLSPSQTFLWKPIHKIPSSLQPTILLGGFTEIIFPALQAPNLTRFVMTGSRFQLSFGNTRNHWFEGWDHYRRKTGLYKHGGTYTFFCHG